MTTRIPSPPPSDPLSAGAIAAELQHAADGIVLPSDYKSVASRPHDVSTTLTLLWVQGFFALMQLILAPMFFGGTPAPLALGPKLAIVLAYLGFAVHFSLGHAKMRLPYVVFSLGIMALSFLGLSQAGDWVGTTFTGIGILVAGASLYGVTNTETSAWLAACAERLALPVSTGRPRSSDVRENLASACAKRRRASTRQLALAGLAWLAGAGAALWLTVCTGEQRAVAVAALSLAPLALAGVSCLTFAGLRHLRWQREA